MQLFSAQCCHQESVSVNPPSQTLPGLILTHRFCSDGALGRSGPDAGGRRSYGGPVLPIHEVMGCGAADSPWLIADSHRLSPYKSLQEDLAQATGMGEGTQIWDSKTLEAEMDDFQRRRTDGTLEDDGGGLKGGMVRGVLLSNDATKMYEQFF